MTGLLDGMRVLDAGMWRPVPHATQMLADLGAEVLKIELPAGDPMRTFPSIFADVASYKRSVALDLKTEAGRERALELVAGADVFTEGWRPGVAARLGLSYDAVRACNRDIIYCSISGYGQTGPLVDRTGHDLNYQSLAGVLSPRHEADVPEIPRLPVADLAAGAYAAFCIAAAWAKKLRTGEGEHIDVAMADVVAAWRGPHGSLTLAGRAEQSRGSTGYGVFRCADGGYLTLAVIAEDHFWRAICDVFGLAALRDLTHYERLDRYDECQSAVAEACAALNRDTAVARLAAAGAPVAPVLSAEEMAAHEQFRSRGVVVDGADGDPRVGFPAVLQRHPVRPPGPSPEIGEHSAGRA